MVPQNQSGPLGLLVTMVAATKDGNNELISSEVAFPTQGTPIVHTNRGYLCKFAWREEPCAVYVELGQRKQIRLPYDEAFDSSDLSIDLWDVVTGLKVTLTDEQNQGSIEQWYLLGSSGGRIGLRVEYTDNVTYKDDFLQEGPMMGHLGGEFEVLVKNAEVATPIPDVTIAPHSAKHMEEAMRGLHDPFQAKMWPQQGDYSGVPNPTTLFMTGMGVPSTQAPQQWISSIQTDSIQGAGNTTTCGESVANDADWGEPRGACASTTLKFEGDHSATFSSMDDFRESFREAIHQSTNVEKGRINFGNEKQYGTGSRF